MKPAEDEMKTCDPKGSLGMKLCCLSVFIVIQFSHSSLLLFAK
ncbi:hypothetical protein HanIR_Chr15g0781061 [Helianthus annuus]|nr:hypothetical protein HanIR_Chr15g0781061 [Helianthus annuus]